MSIELEIRRKELIQVTENIVEAFLCDITQEGKYSPKALRGMAEYWNLDAYISEFLIALADKIERLARENTNCTCTPDSTEACIACKLLA
jgi:hypothetical protein